MTALSDTIHHTSTRIACACGARVYAYATDTDGINYCRKCAHRRRGNTLCRKCARPIIQHGSGEWAHYDGVTARHEAIPEPAPKQGSWADTLIK